MFTRNKHFISFKKVRIYLRIGIGHDVVFFVVYKTNLFTRNSNVNLIVINNNKLIK